MLAPENAEASLLDMGSRIDRNAEDMPGVAKKMRKEELNGQEYLPAGMPVNPYTFLMSQGANQGEAARTLADAYSEVARGTANAIGGSGGEMETLAKGLLFALTGQGLGGSPVSRLSHVLNNYDPVLPNTQEVSGLPSLLKNISPMTEEERKMFRTAGEFLSPL